MRKALGSTCHCVETEEVQTASGEVGLEINVRTDEEHTQSNSVVLSRQAQISLFHQLNNYLFKR